MDAVFYFSFYIDPTDNDDECTTRHLSFYITNIRKPWSVLEEELADVASDLELDYGVHDWGSSPSGVNAVGYNSSDVEQQCWDELMEKWRQAFVEYAPGCVVSNVFDVPNMDDMNDAEILQFTKETHEHQQAAQERAILSAHVGGGSAVAPSKKM